MNDRRILVLLPATVAFVVSACGGGGGGRNGNSPPPAQSIPGRVQFEAGTFSVDEGAGTAKVTITRSDGSDGAVSVSVASGDGSAAAGADYTAINTTVSFAAGDADPKTVTVPIADDGDTETDETLSLALSAPGGGASIGAIAAATLTIRDNEPPPALTIDADIKQLKFGWASVAGATRYRLLQKVADEAQFVQVGADIAADATSARLEVAVHRHDWLNARYQLEACNPRGCAPSNEVRAFDVMLEAIGYFKASNTEPGDEFGSAVALSADGNTLAITAPREDSSAIGVDGNQANNTAGSAGAIYVFVRALPTLTWSQQAYLKASNTGAVDRFGSSLALSADGNTLAAGAPLEDSGAVAVNGDQSDNSVGSAGAVYVFARVGTLWSQQAYVKASNTGAIDEFGSAVALSSDGNMLAVGAPLENSSSTGTLGFGQADDSADNAGAVYVFTRDVPTLLWSQQAYLKASNTDASDRFGAALALSADASTLAVGAPSEASGATGIDGDQSDDTAARAGAVYVFARDRKTESWSQQAYVKASNAESGDGFGFSVILSADGDTLAVGAPEEDSGVSGTTGRGQDDNSALAAGAAYVFARVATTWSQQAYLKASNADEGDQFGTALALSADGNTLAGGAPEEDSGATAIGGDDSDDSLLSAGAAYIFARTDNRWSQQAFVKPSNTRADDLFGTALSLSADADALVVGAIEESGGATGIDGDQSDFSAPGAGAAYVY